MADDFKLKKNEVSRKYGRSGSAGLVGSWVKATGQEGEGGDKKIKLYVVNPLSEEFQTVLPDIQEIAKPYGISIQEAGPEDGRFLGGRIAAP